MWWICFPFHLWRRVQTEGDSEGTISIHLVLLWWSSPRHVLGVPLSHAPRGTHTFQPFSQRRLLAAQSPRDCCSRDSADQGLVSNNREAIAPPEGVVVKKVETCGCLAGRARAVHREDVWARTTTRAQDG